MKALAFIGVYAIGAWVGHSLVVDPGHIVLFWPPIGLLLGVLLTTTPSQWPAFLSLAFTTTVALNLLWREQPIAGAVGLALATTVEGATAAGLMRWFFGDRLRFERVNDVFALLAISVLVAAPIAALIGAASSYLYLAGDFWRELRSWWLGDVLGIVLLTPPVVAAAHAQGDRELPDINRGGIAELIVSCVTIALVAALVYGSPPRTGIPAAILFPTLIWVAARFGATGMSLVLLGITVIAAHLTAADLGPSAHLESSVGRALALQTVMISYGMAGWVLATLWRELRQALADLRTANLYLEETVAERTANLAASETRFRSIFEHAATGIAIADLDGALEQCNPAFSAMLGSSATQLTGLPLVDVLHPDDRRSMVARLETLRDGSTSSFATESRFLHRAGSPVSVDAFVSLLRDNRSRPTHLVALVSDITERKRIEDDLRNADRRKDEFIAMLAHELRNPLAPIRSAVAVLRTRPLSDSVVVRCRDILARQVTHIVRLLDDLLDISRLSRGRLSLQRAHVSLDQILDAALETIRPLIAHFGHTLTVERPDHEVVVFADMVRLTQVLVNLLDNAAKYTPAGGTIRVIARAHDRQVVVTVEDSGIGIDPEMLEGIFQMFVQGRQDSPSSGLGLGLALVRRLVNMHGGTITASSSGLGLGSRFTVVLPLDDGLSTQANATQDDSSIDPPVIRSEVITSEIPEIGSQAPSPTHRSLDTRAEVPRQH